MGDRRRAREWALQMLYQADLTQADSAEIFTTFWQEKTPLPETRVFAERLVAGTLRWRAEIDAVLREGLEHWRLPRIAAVDRNVLRMAVYEFLHEPDVPPVVVIDEAIELAKKFGGEESGIFVNGVLDGIRKRLEASRAARLAPPTPAEG
jgi:N utilization substance protein B